MTTKYLVEIQTGTGTYEARCGWDVLYARRAEAEVAARRAADLFGGTRVVAMDVPENVDHLYRCLTMDDTTCLYR